MKKKTEKKLVLAKETVRNLELKDLKVLGACCYTVHYSCDNYCLPKHSYDLSC